MRLIVGLGNPGQEYQNTRHNLGFLALDELAAKLACPLRQKRFNSLYGLVSCQGERFLLVKPQTYMNRSGSAVRAWLNYYQLSPGDVLAVYDEIALDLGRLRLRQGGSAAGHRGVQSLIGELAGDGFGRLRLGIGPQPAGMDSADYVLQAFRPEERPLVGRVVAVVPEIVMCWSHEGLTQAMNRYNGFGNQPA